MKRTASGYCFLISTNCVSNGVYFVFVVLLTHKLLFNPKPFFNSFPLEFDVLMPSSSLSSSLTTMHVSLPCLSLLSTDLGNGEKPELDLFFNSVNVLYCEALFSNSSLISVFIEKVESLCLVVSLTVQQAFWFPVLWSWDTSRLSDDWEDVVPFLSLWLLSVFLIFDEMLLLSFDNGRFALDFLFCW